MSPVPNHSIKNLWAISSSSVLEYIRIVRQLLRQRWGQLDQVDINRADAVGLVVAGLIPIEGVMDHDARSVLQ